MRRFIYLLASGLTLLPLMAFIPTACANKYSVAPKAAFTPTCTPTPNTSGCNNGGNVSTLAGGGCSGCINHGYANGQGVAAEFFQPTGTAADCSGNVYVADYQNNLIRKIGPGGNVSTLAGGGGGTNSGHVDGQGINALFYHPVGVAVDTSGYSYVADLDNNLIRKIDPGGNVSTLAGGGCTGCVNPGYADGQGTNAMFNLPYGLAVDGSGNVYVADNDNNLVRKITPGGNVSTLAGGGCAGCTNHGYADGQGTNAVFYHLCSVAVDGSGNIYVADEGNNLIRKVTPGGYVSTLAGGGCSGCTNRGYANGQGVNAVFYSPQGVAVDGTGNVYVADEGNNLIRKINPSGNVSTLAGGGGGINSGNADGQGTNAEFNAPNGVGTDCSCHVYVADQNNNLIRLIQ